MDVRDVQDGHGDRGALRPDLDRVVLRTLGDDDAGASSRVIAGSLPEVQGQGLGGDAVLGLRP